jgi:uncharacterized membrane protein
VATRRATAWIGRDARAVAHLLWAGLIGVVAAVIASEWSPWQLAVLIGWGVAAAAIVARSWTIFVRSDHNATADHAQMEDESRSTTHLVLVLASVGSLIVEVVALVKASQTEGTQKVLLTALVAVTVFVSWAVVHTIYTLRYAQIYYGEDPGGVNFNNDQVERPDYLDFAYLAFTIGMTYQVSDTDLTRRQVRRAALGQALLSYVFGTVVIATTINIVASFIR